MDFKMHKQLMLLVMISIMFQPFLFAEDGGQPPVADPTTAQPPVLASEVTPSVPPVNIETSAGIGVITPGPSDVRPVSAVAVAPSEGLNDTIQHMSSSADVLQPPVSDIPTPPNPDGMVMVAQPGPPSGGTTSQRVVDIRDSNDNVIGEDLYSDDNNTRTTYMYPRQGTATAVQAHNNALLAAVNQELTTMRREWIDSGRPNDGTRELIRALLQIRLGINRFTGRGWIYGSLQVSRRQNGQWVRGPLQAWGGIPEALRSDWEPWIRSSSGRISDSTLRDFLDSGNL